MPGPENEPARRSVVTRFSRALRDPGFPAALAVAALLLFCWPFARVPRLELEEAWVHLFAAWVLAIAALALLSRAYAGPEDEGRDA